MGIEETGFHSKEQANRVMIAVSLLDETTTDPWSTATIWGEQGNEQSLSLIPVT